MSIPPCYRVEQRTRRGAWITGIVLAGVGELVLVSAAERYDLENGSAWYLVPIAGPFIPTSSQQAAQSDSCSGGDYCNFSATISIILGNLLHVAAGILVGVGFGATKSVLAPDPTAPVVLPARVGEGYGFIGAARF